MEKPHFSQCEFNQKRSANFGIAGLKFVLQMSLSKCVSIEQKQHDF